MVRKSMLRPEIAVIERNQPLPMPLGRVAIVDRPLRKCEAMMGAGIDFDFGIGALAGHRLLYFLDDLRRGVDVGLGAAEIKFGLCLGAGKMGAVRLIGRKMRAVDRCGGLEAMGK